MNDTVQINVMLLSVFAGTTVGIYFYRQLAIHYKIIATKNFRTLHRYDIPKGGGLIFSLASIITISYLWARGIITGNTALPISIGGTIATLFGFLDDIIHLPAITKFIIQIILSAFTLIWFLWMPLLSMTDQVSFNFYLLISPIILLALVWMINLYNFMDGIDGMAASGTVFICVVIGALLLLIQNDFATGLIVAILGISCLSFLLHNWPPAKVFMGDAGSLFLGYIFGVLIIKTIIDGNISIWTWLIVFGYFVSDTTTTLIVRIFRVKKWYGAHRSHAYQNLARIWDNHLKVVSLVMLYHLVWLLPLAIGSVLFRQYQEAACILAIIPVIFWTLRYGPLLSSN